MFCNIDFDLIRKSELFQRRDGLPKRIATVNAQFIVLANNDRRFMEILNKSACTFDGEIPLKIARRRPEYKNAEALKGSEIIYDFIAYAKENDLKLFLLGGKEESNTLAVKRIREEYQGKADGFSPAYEPYPFSEDFVRQSLEHIREAKPDILFVGFGAPKQEYFIDDHYEEFAAMGIRYIVGCGGTFEFLSGTVKRAPAWVSKAGFESVYRLFQEMTPARWKRIFESFRFLRYIRHEPDYAK